MTASLPEGPVLITGGSGFLGRALTDALLETGQAVVIFDRSAPDDMARDGLSVESGDIRDLDTLRGVIDRHGVGAIAHLAALVIPACRDNPVLGAEVNVIGHINVLEAARLHGIDRLLYTSSLAAKPRAPYGTPHNLYGAYKHCCEQIAAIYALDHGLNAVGLRPNVVYGPGREEGETAAITHAIRAAAEGRAYELPFSGGLCLQHVDEVVDIFLRCLAARPEAPVVSDLTTEVRSIADLVATIRAQVPGARITARPQERAAPGGLDNAPLRALIGDWEAVGLEVGVARTLAQFRADRAA